MAARSRVLGSPELLETILLQLDMRTLLLSQRVSHFWHDLISQSPGIQRHLFFLPARSENPNTEQRIQNPLLKELFPPWFPSQDYELALYSLFPKLPMARNKEAFLRSGASWRHMLVAQPPITAIALMDRRGYGLTRHTMRFGADGLPCLDGTHPLRMGTLYEMFQQRMMQGQHAWVIWPGSTGTPPPEFRPKVIEATVRGTGLAVCIERISRADPVWGFDLEARLEFPWGERVLPEWMEVEEGWYKEEYMNKREMQEKERRFRDDLRAFEEDIARARVSVPRNPLFDEVLLE